jgi:hypothetical protein
MNELDEKFFESCYLSGMVSDLSFKLNVMLSDEQKKEVIKCVEESVDEDIKSKYRREYQKLNGMCL